MNQTQKKNHKPGWRLAGAGLLLALANSLAAGETAVPGADPDAEAKLAKLSGTNALPDGGQLSVFTLRGDQKGGGQLSKVEVTGMPFTEALRIKTLRKPEKIWDLQLSAQTADPFVRNDVGMVSFFARAVEPAAEQETVEGEVLFERSSEPWSKSLHEHFSVGREWKKFYCPFEIMAEWGPAAKNKYAPGELHVGINLGVAPQVIELAELKLQKFSAGVSLYDLPYNKVTYAGREPDAAWRQAAAERIERIRKADLALRVVDAAGRPVPGAKLSVVQTKQDFYRGTCVNGGLFQRSAGTPEGERYRAEIKRLFNLAVFEGMMKWPSWDKAKGKALEITAWLAANGLAVRSHCLVWPSWKYTPADLKEHQQDAEYLRRRCLEHIQDECSALRGKVIQYDVMNEPYSNHDLMDVLGQSVMVDWWKAAKSADPEAKLFINDYGILTDDREHQDHYAKTIKYLLDNGAPLEGIGLQSHFHSQCVPPTRLLEILDRFGQFNLPIMITEYDQRLFDEDCQGDYMRDFLTVIFSHPAVQGFLMWGFWDGSHWLNNAPIFKRDWTLKKSGQAYIDLFLNQWLTKAEGAADAQGEYRLRGFLGEYEVVASQAGREVRQTVRLGQGGQTATLKFE